MATGSGGAGASVVSGAACEGACAGVLAWGSSEAGDTAVDDTAASASGVGSTSAGTSTETSAEGGAIGAGALAETGAPVRITARAAPTGTVSSSATRISCSTPAIGDGISVSTLSVEISSRGSSSATLSPTCLSHRVTIPSVTDSPSAGITTRSLGPTASVSTAGASTAGASTAGASTAGASTAGASTAGASTAGASTAGASTAGASTAGAGASSAGAAGSAAGSVVVVGVVGAASALAPVPMIASGAPTATVSSSATRICSSTPPNGEGISVSTLSVETSTKGSSTATVSPTCLSQRVTVPSVTLSPSAGIVTESDMTECLLLVCGSAMSVQRLAGQRKMRLAEGLVLGGVSVHEGGDVLGMCLPVHDQLAFSDELADARTDHVHADDRSVPHPYELDEPRRAEDLALAIAAQVVLDHVDRVGAVHLARLDLRQPDRRDLGGTVGDPGDAALVDGGGCEAGDLLGDEDALLESALGELEAGHDVADGVDVRDTRVQPLVRDDESAVECHALLLVTEAVRARAAPYGDEQQIGVDRLARLERDVHAVVVLGRAAEPHAHPEGDPALAEGPLEGLGERLVLVRDEVRQGLDDRDVRAEGLPDAGELDADHAAAEHHDGPRHVVQLESLVGGDDPTADLEAGQ